MAIELAAVYVPITPSMKGVAAKIQAELGGVDVSGIGSKVGESFGSKIMDAVGGVAKVGAVAIGGVVAAGLGTALVKGFARLDAIDVARAKLTGLGNDAGTVKAIMSDALASVKGTAFGLGEAASVAAAAVAANIQPGEQLQKHLKNIANNAAAAGVSMDEMGAIFNKAATQANGVQNDVIGQLADKGIPIYQKLAEQMGVTAGEVFKLASDGKIDFETFSAAATAAAGTVADQMGGTVRGSLANFFASLGRIGAGLLGGVFPQIAPTVKGITAALEPLEAVAARVGDRIGQAINPALQNLVGIVSGDVQVAWIATLSTAFTALFSAFNGEGITSSGIVGAFEAIGVAARQIFDAFAPLAPQIMALWSSFSPLSLILQVIGPILPQLAGAFGSLATTIGTALGGAVQTLLPVAQQLVSVLAGALGQALSAILPAIVQVIGLLGPVFSTVLQALMPVITTLASVFGQLVTAVTPLLTPLIGLLSPIAELIAALLPPLVQLFSALVVPILGLIPPIANLLVPILQVVVNILATVITWVADAISWFVRFVTGQEEAGTQFQTVWNNVMGFFSAIGQFFTNIWNGLIVGVAKFALDVVRFFQDIPGNIQKVFTGAGNWLVDVGRNIIQGLLDGATSLLRNIGSFFLDILPDWIKVPFKAALGIASPSKVFAGYGRYTMEGYIAGLDSMHSKVEDAILGTTTFSPAIIAASALLTPSSPVTADPSSGASQPIYVQNPFTGEYLLAKVAEVAAGEVTDAQYRGAVKASGGKVTA